MPKQLQNLKRNFITGGPCEACEALPHYQKRYIMKTDHALFLLELSSLLEKHKVGIFHTDGDGPIHIEADGKEIFVGYLFDDTAGETLYENVIKKGVS
jgi:hypothetical protein